MKRLLVWALWGFLLLPSTVWAAIAVDATSSGSTTGATSVTVAHTVTGSNLELVCTATIYVSGSETVSSWTYNTGENLTQVATALSSDTRVEMWALKAPSTGTHNWVVTASGSTQISAECVSFTGVDQTTPLGTAATATGTSTTPSVNVSSAAGELVVDGLAGTSFSGQTPSVGAGQTQQVTVLCGSCANSAETTASTEAGAGTVTMSYTINNAWNWAIAAVPLKAAGGGAASETFGFRLRLQQ